MTESTKSKGQEKITAHDVADMLLKQIEQGTAPFQLPWEPGQIPHHHNPTTNASYQGFNQLTLQLIADKNGYSDTRWMTYKQAEAAGAQVRKGEKSAPLSYYGPMSKKRILNQSEASSFNLGPNGKADFMDQQGNKVTVSRLADGRVQEETIKWQVIPFRVFNAEQIDNLPEVEIPVVSQEEKNERIDKMLDSLGVEVVHTDKSSSHYDQINDNVNMPLQTQFESPDRYYQSLLHEVSHWTGTEDRLNRDMSGRFGSQAYAREEIRAEMASFMMSAELGVGFEPQSAAYIQSWLEAVENDKKELFKATNDVNKIQGMVMKHDPQRELDNQQNNTNQNTAQSQSQDNEASQGRVYLNVTREEKDEAKALGAKWDWKDKKQWYVPEGTALEPFEKWLPEQQQQNEVNTQDETPENEQVSEAATPDQQPGRNNSGRGRSLPSADERIDLKVSFEEKDEAKALGARWHFKEKTWYITKDQDGPQFDKWKRDLEPEVSPSDSFAQALADAGLKLDGPPVMDGQWHNVPVEGDKPGDMAGSYMAHADGVPNGYYQNFKENQGEPTKWVHKSSQLTPQVRNAMRQSNDDKAANREQQRIERRDAAIEKFTPLVEAGMQRGGDYDSHPYLESKGIIGNIPGTYVDRGNLHIPVKECGTGEIVGVQYIHGQDGSRTVKGKELPIKVGDKAFVRGSQKSGSYFHLPPSDPQKDSTVLVAEGFATGVTLRDLTGHRVMVAFDSGNLKNVTQFAREQLPDANILIVADNDVPSKHYDNVGVQKAEEAALENNAQFTYMNFTEEEKQSGLSDFNDYVENIDVQQGRNILLREIERTEQMHGLGVQADEFINEDNEIINRKTGAVRDLVDMERNLEHAEEKQQDDGYER